MLLYVTLSFNLIIYLGKYLIGSMKHKPMLKQF